MKDFVPRALIAKRESKRIEFKESFDASSLQSWCEILKDIISIANSGGGAVLIGVDNQGIPTGGDVSSLLEVDPAQIVDKVYQYTETHYSDFEIHSTEKCGAKLVALNIGPAPIPIVFTRPGTYPVGKSKQRTSFSKGTVYFRHGAKSEPGNSEDLRQAIERRLEEVRKSWIDGVRKVIRAPAGAEVEISQPVRHPSLMEAASIRIVDDLSAPSFGSVDKDKTHPHRQKELIANVRGRLPDNVKFNQYDV